VGLAERGARVVLGDRGDASKTIASSAIRATRRFRWRSTSAICLQSKLPAIGSLKNWGTSTSWSTTLGPSRPRPGMNPTSTSGNASWPSWRAL